QRAEPVAELRLETPVEFFPGQTAQRFGLFGAAAPHNAVNITGLRVGKGGQGAAAGESFIGPAGLGPTCPNIGQHRVLTVLTFDASGPGAVGLHCQAGTDHPISIATLDTVTAETRYGTPLQTLHTAVFQ